MVKQIISLLFLICFPLQVSSQTQLDDSTKSSNDKFIAEAKKIAPIREEPPHGYFRYPGDKVGTTEEGEKYEVVGLKKLPYLFSTQTWAEVKLVKHKDTPIEGWVYWGEVDKLCESINFTVNSHCKK